MKPNDGVRAILDKEGVKSFRSYTITDMNVGNMLSVLLMLDENQSILSRGVAICSVLDSFNYKNGRKAAFKRALKALVSKETSMPIDNDSQRWKRLSTVRTLKWTRQEPITIEWLDLFYRSYTTEFLDKENLEERQKELEKNKKIFYKLDRYFHLNFAKTFFNYKSEYHPLASSFDEESIKDKKRKFKLEIVEFH
jgi:hypothetical protein